MKSTPVRGAVEPGRILAKQGKLQLQKETGNRERRNGTNDEAVEEGRWGLGGWASARPVSGLVERARCGAWLQVELAGEE